MAKLVCRLAKLADLAAIFDFEAKTLPDAWSKRSLLAALEADQQFIYLLVWELGTYQTAIYKNENSAALEPKNPACEPLTRLVQPSETTANLPQEIVGLLHIQIVDNVAEIFNFGVAKNWRSRGIAKTFLEVLAYGNYPKESRLQSWQKLWQIKGVQIIADDILKLPPYTASVLEVRASNKSAYQLYLHAGWRQIATIKRFYREPAYGEKANWDYPGEAAYRLIKEF